MAAHTVSLRAPFNGYKIRSTSSTPSPPPPSSTPLKIWHLLWNSCQLSHRAPTKSEEFSNDLQKPFFVPHPFARRSLSLSYFERGGTSPRKINIFPAATPKKCKSKIYDRHFLAPFFFSSNLFSSSRTKKKSRRIHKSLLKVQLPIFSLYTNLYSWRRWNSMGAESERIFLYFLKREYKIIFIKRYPFLPFMRPL